MVALAQAPRHCQRHGDAHCHRHPGDHAALAVGHQESARLDHRALLVTTVAVRLFAIPVETIGSKFGGIPTGLPAISIPEFRADLILPLLPSALHGGDAGGDRKPAVGRRGRQHERRPAQARRRAPGPRHRESGRAAVRRHPGHRRDRPHGDQHSLRRDIARRRNRACTHAAGDRAGGRAAGQLHSAADAGRDPDGRRLSHGRMARDPVDPAALGRRSRWCGPRRSRSRCSPT